MNNAKATQNKIIQLAENDDRIRAVLLNGSRANPNAKPDIFQNFDLTFFMNDYNSFLMDRSWILQLGKVVLQQLPDEMELGKEEEKIGFTFLMVFENGERIDLTLFPLTQFENHYQTDSLSVVWMDKDDLFENIPQASDIDYRIRRPTQREFTEVCNEFWWTITNVAKGLKRNEIIYAKDMMETVVRPMFIRLIEWKVAHENDFKINTGKSAKFIEQFLPKKYYQKLLRTYADSALENNWEALFIMTEIFKEEQLSLAKNLDFKVNLEEMNQSLKYLEDLYNYFD